ncbi:hypothetical protein HanRHA438_Chr01g0022291 [Helianthus annuus]|nr:hypothetical protein HanRHA438_Chr01g0022291 [Helianthus annuus]
MLHCITINHFNKVKNIYIYTRSYTHTHIHVKKINLRSIGYKFTEFFNTILNKLSIPGPRPITFTGFGPFLSDISPFL